ncbi:hypothetical protein [Nocardioides sp.]|uniref:hypothetical protein n=1 Tax=Nocardioides sp. TaxID=35761 RepID=UPI002604AB25|nr:hypothetical protein [Nocardioides sp.]
MNQQWTAPVWVVVALVAGVLAALLVLVLLVGATRRSLVRVRHEADALLGRVGELEQRLSAREETVPPGGAAATVATDREYVITHLGEEPAPAAAAPVVPAPVFADLVLRESVVQAATLAAGLRRALSPETRHRIRFEMRREVKRARKQRRADLRAARRDLHDRERAAA